MLIAASKGEEARLGLPPPRCGKKRLGARRRAAKMTVGVMETYALPNNPTTDAIAPAEEVSPFDMSGCSMAIYCIAELGLCERCTL